MHTIAFISLWGGIGQTAVVANVATALARDGLSCLAIELCAQNSLGLCLGLEAPVPRGWVHAVQEGAWWAQAALANSDGVGFLPYGMVDNVTVDVQERRWLDQPGWLAEQLASLDVAERSLVLLDAPQWPTAAARQAMACADWLVVCVEASPRVESIFPRLEALRVAQPAGQGLTLVVNRVDPRRQSQREPLQALRLQWAEFLAPYLLHEDDHMPLAMARHGCVVSVLPQAQSAHDLQGIAQWLVRKFGMHSQEPSL